MRGISAFIFFVVLSFINVIALAEVVGEEVNDVEEKPKEKVSVRIKQIEEEAAWALAELLGADTAREGTNVASIYRIAADKLRALGTAKAEGYYIQAMRAAPKDPKGYFLYAEYLRQYRGPARPLLPMAGELYFKALELLEERKTSGVYKKSKSQKATDEKLFKDIEWSLLDLYQRDGAPILHWSPYVIDPQKSYNRPLGFLSSQFEYGYSEISIRDLVSSLNFLQDSINRDLTNQELRDLVRSPIKTDWFNQLRLRPAHPPFDYFPWIDIFWNNIEAEGSNVNRLVPGDFFDFRERTWGIAAERAFNLYPWIDLDLRVGYKHSERKVILGGLDIIEVYYTPFVDLKASRVFPGFFGVNQVAFELTYEHSSIHNRSEPDSLRNAGIGSVILRYSIFPDKEGDEFVLRATTLEAGVTRFVQQFGVKGGGVDLIDHNFFTTLTLRQLFHKNLDLSAGYTLFTAHKDRDDFLGAEERDHHQGRIQFLPLWRLIDNENATNKEERKSPIRVVNLVGLFDYTFKQQGPFPFESYRYGIRMDGRIAHPKAYRTTFLLFGEFSKREYFRLGEGEFQFRVGIKMGF